MVVIDGFRLGIKKLPWREPWGRKAAGAAQGVKGDGAGLSGPQETQPPACLRTFTVNEFAGAMRPLFASSRVTTEANQNLSGRLCCCGFSAGSACAVATRSMATLDD